MSNRIWISLHKEKNIHPWHFETDPYRDPWIRTLDYGSGSYLLYISFNDNKSSRSHKTVEIQILLNFFACWWTDSDPDTDPYKNLLIQILEAQKLMELTDPDPLRIRNTVNYKTQYWSMSSFIMFWFYCAVFIAYCGSSVTDKKTSRSFWCLLLLEGAFTSAFIDKKSKRSQKVVEIKVFRIYNIGFMFCFHCAVWQRGSVGAGAHRRGEERPTTPQTTVPPPAKLGPIGTYCLRSLFSKWNK